MRTQSRLIGSSVSSIHLVITLLVLDDPMNRWSDGPIHGWPDDPMNRQMSRGVIPTIKGFDLTFEGRFSILMGFGSASRDFRQTFQGQPWVSPKLLTPQKGK